MAAANLGQEISSHLLTKGFIPTSAWLTTFLTTQRPSTPLPAIKQSALFRLTASDITTSLQRSPGSIFPQDIHNGQIRERSITGPIAVQVIDIQDIGRSAWSQLELFEAEERGETTKGREIIRVLPGEEGPETTTQQSTGPHKLTLQDAQGTCVFGMELMNIEGISIGMSIGTKMVLRDVIVARGLLLLEPKCVTVLGGKIDDLHKKWKEGRKEALRAAAQAGNA
jgi:RecQ-mediated genome instability protein 1